MNLEEDDILAHIGSARWASMLQCIYQERYLENECSERIIWNVNARGMVPKDDDLRPSASMEK